MRNKYLNGLAIIVLILSTISCAKDSIKVDDNSTSQKEIKSDIVWNNYLDGVQVASIDTNQTIAVTFADGVTNTTFSFSTETLYFRWAEKQNYTLDGQKLDLVSIQINLTIIGEYAILTHADDYYDQYGTIRQDVIDLMDSLKINHEPKVGTRQLWDEEDFVSSIHFSGLSPIPSLGSARNRAESAKQIGLLNFNAYCDKRWFMGSRYYWYSNGISEKDDLHDISWANRWESISIL
jgi:hypothetical protein